MSYLIIATSGRMLAQFACREGYEAFVIDCFADVDTRRYAKKVFKIKFKCQSINQPHPIPGIEISVKFTDF